ncbi:hypothetical protein Q7P35_001315 [Cladosporium inversicolor]
MKTFLSILTNNDTSTSFIGTQVILIYQLSWFGLVWRHTWTLLPLQDTIHSIALPGSQLAAGSSRPSPGAHFASPHLACIPTSPQDQRPQTATSSTEGYGQQKSPPTHLPTLPPCTGLSQRTPSPSHRRPLARARALFSPNAQPKVATEKNAEKIAQPLERPTHEPESKPVGGPCACALSRSLASAPKRGQTKARKDPD